MDIKDIAEKLNELAIQNNHPVGELQQIRKRIGKIKTNRKAPIFEKRSISKEYAFHFGGRQEIQFNFGEEVFNNKPRLGYGLHFSLHQDISVHNPIDHFTPKINRVNEFLDSNPKILEGLTMWYFEGAILKKEEILKRIPSAWVKNGNSISIGNHIDKVTSKITIGDIHKILTLFDKLLPLYEYVESESAKYVQPELHIVIEDLLRSNGAPLTPRQILDKIKSGKLWYMPSTGELPSINQIHARIANYSQLFSKNNGYIKLKASSTIERRLLRLTWNEYGWQLPSGHSWKKEDQGNNNVAFEKQYGFGAEEWLLNPRNNIDGYQYGYIRGLWEVQKIDFLDEIYLFTINPLTKDRLLIARIANIELLDPDDLPKDIKLHFDKHEDDVINELKSVKADYSGVTSHELYPLVKFRMEDAEIYDYPILINELKSNNRFNRFKPYNIDKGLDKVLSDIVKVPKFIFKPGKRKNENGAHTKKNTAKTIDIPGLHMQIEKDLEEFLKPEYSVAKQNISIELSRCGENIPDVVLKEDNGNYTIIEIKTSYNIRYNIRDAIGQLLDYAFWHDGLKIHELIIISPSELKAEHSEYFSRIKKSFNLRISYWQYFTAKSSKKFIKH